MGVGPVLASLVVSWLAWAGPGGGSADLEAVLGDERVQWELPRWEPGDPGDGASGSADSVAAGAQDAGGAWDGDLRADPEPPPWIGPGLLGLLLGTEIGWIVLLLLGFAGLVTIVVLVIQAVTGRSAAPDPRAPPAAPGTVVRDGSDDAVATPTRDEIDALAAAGRHDEAVHLLLLRALVLLQHEARRRWPRALTSREILGRGRFDHDVRAPLGALVEAVERSRFGARPIGAQDYDECRVRAAELEARAGGAA